MKQGHPATLAAGAAAPSAVGVAGAELAPGTMVDQYQIEGLIGRGGMGSVYAARQPVIDKRVAIKVLAGLADPPIAERFVAEARVVNRIGHPNIIDIFAFGRLPDGRNYFVMELLEGKTLAAHLEADDLPPALARKVLREVCDALAAAHAQNVVHRDLKPDNIFLVARAGGEVAAKILDFGIAKLLGEASAKVTQTGVVLGTPYFMSPEQCLGQAIDQRSDIYALGVILYLMFAGRLPFRGTTFAEVIAQHVTATPPPPSVHRPVAPALERLILACLAKDPGARPSDARTLATRLEAALVDGATAAPGVAATAPRQAFDASTANRPQVSRGRRVLVTGAALAVAAAGGFYLSASRPRSAPPPAPARAPQANAKEVAGGGRPTPPESVTDGASSGLKSGGEAPPPGEPARRIVRPTPRPAAVVPSTPSAPAAPPGATPPVRRDDTPLVRENPFR